MTSKKLQSYRLGYFAEYFAILYFFFCGYILLAHRYRSKFGEIDLIFKSMFSKEIVFVEVKARKDVSNVEVLTSNQKNRISRSASFFIATNANYSGFSSRFDLIIFNNVISLKHIKNAWFSDEF